MTKMAGTVTVIRLITATLMPARNSDAGQLPHLRRTVAVSTRAAVATRAGEKEAIPDPKSGRFLPRASNVEQNLQNDVDFQQARSSSQ
jgi:hypothetical protein